MLTETSGSFDAGATLYIQRAPTEGTLNYGLWVDSGATRLDGTLCFGTDVQLSRGAANRLDLAAGHDFRVAGTCAGLAEIIGGSCSAFFSQEGGSGCFAYVARVTGDANRRLRIQTNGAISWGNGACSPDVVMLRGAANRLDIFCGDSLRLRSGSLQFGTTVSLSAGTCNQLTIATGDSLRLVSGSITVVCQVISDASGNLASANGLACFCGAITNLTIVNGIVTAAS